MKTPKNNSNQFAWLPRFGIAAAAISVVAFAISWTFFGSGIARAEEPKKPAAFARELFIPLEDLPTVLEGAGRRVLLSREKYEELRKQVPPAAPTDAPVNVAVLAADYTGKLEEGRALIRGNLAIEVFRDGWQPLPIALSGVGIRQATLDGQPAAIGRGPGGEPTLFVKGKGQHSLVLELSAPLQTTAALQSLDVQLPVAATARLNLTVPGNVEVKRGGEVLKREYVAGANETKLELTVPRGPLSLVLTLNNKFLQQQRVVVARSLQAAEMTTAYERIFAQVSLHLLHGASDEFTLAVPEGFEVQAVDGPLVSQWSVMGEKTKSLAVKLREPTAETVVLSVTAFRTSPRLNDWSYPEIVPQGVEASISLLGLLVEDRMDVAQLETSGVEPLDVDLLTSTLPEAALAAVPGAPKVRPVSAWYAPVSEHKITGKFTEPKEEFSVTSQLQLLLDDRHVELAGSLAVIPQRHKLVSFEFILPAGWQLTDLTHANAALSRELYSLPKGETRVVARLPQAVAARTPALIQFRATQIPDGWLGDWKEKTFDFPVVRFPGAAQVDGTLSVVPADDLTVEPGETKGLVVLTRAEMSRAQINPEITPLARRFEQVPYEFQLKIARRNPHVSARVYAWFKLTPGNLEAKYELHAAVSEARTRRLQFRLPANFSNPTIVGLDGVVVKETTNEAGTDGMRHWTVQLAQPASGRVRLAISVTDRRSTDAQPKLDLPMLIAEGVDYQSSLVAVEGSAELEVTVKDQPARVDLGEMVADVDFQLGQRLVGVYRFLGDQPAIAVSVTQRVTSSLATTIVRRAELITRLGSATTSVTAARYLLRSKASFLEVELPKDSKLWGAMFQGRPLKPQLDGRGVLMIPLAAGSPAEDRDLQLVFEQPTTPLGTFGEVALLAPKLFQRAELSIPRDEVPVADAKWQLVVPSGYQVVRSQGWTTNQIARTPAIPALQIAGALYEISGGVHPTKFRTEWEKSPMAYRYDTKSEAKSYDDSRSMKTMESLPEGRMEVRDGVARQEGSPNDFAPTTRDLTDNAPPAPAVDMPAEKKSEVMNAEEKEEPKPEPAVPASPPVDPGALLAIEKLAPMKKEEATILGDGDLFARGYNTVPTRYGWALEGVGSLTFDVAPKSGEDSISFQGLGEEVQLKASLAKKWPFEFLAWGVAGLIFVYGIWRIDWEADAKFRYVFGILLIVTLIPLLTGSWQELDRTFELAFYAAAAVGVWYLLHGFVAWFREKMNAPPAAESPPTATPPVPPTEPNASAPATPSAAPVGIALLLVSLGWAASPVLAQDPPAKPMLPAGAIDAGDALVIPIEPAKPVAVPEDAIVIPYDAADDNGVKKADKVLIPYDQYIRWWSLANPDKPPELTPVPYSLAGAAYQATLAEGDSLKVTGKITVEVLGDKPVEIPLRLKGGVVTSAISNGKPARLRVSQAAPVAEIQKVSGPEPQAAQAAEPQPPVPADVQDGTLLLWQVEGAGSKTLELEIQIKLERRGGWRVVLANLPASPAASLTLTVPLAKTEVRLQDVVDRASYETKGANEKIESALGPQGKLDLQWRPEIAEGAVDKGLKVEATSIFDIREDGWRLVWQGRLEFPRGQRDRFTISVPADFLLEKIVGTNIRGWERKGGMPRSTVEITLLKEARDSESFTVHLAKRRDPKGGAGPESVPFIEVQDAGLQRGIVTIRRSVLLEITSVDAKGLTRIDTPQEAAAYIDNTAGALESPLPLQPYQSYRYTALPFDVKLAVRPLVDETEATVRMLVKVGPRRATLEAQATITPKGRPIHRVRLQLPAGFEPDQIATPSGFERAISNEDGKRILTLWLAGGQNDPVAVTVSGPFAQAGPAPAKLDEVDLPRITVLDVARQETWLVVASDSGFEPEFTVKGLEMVPLGEQLAWLSNENRSFARRAFRARDPEYSGKIQLTTVAPIVKAMSITNLRVTDRTIEETIFFEFQIKRAGLREFEFSLPERFRNERPELPGFARVTTTTPAGAIGNEVRMKVELADAFLGTLRLTIRHDRLLSTDKQAAAIPTIHNHEVESQFITLENAGRDELNAVSTKGLEKVERGQAAFRRLSELLGRDPGEAWSVVPSEKSPELKYQTRPRQNVETADARISLAKATLILDEQGGYRGQQIFRVDNRTDAFLEIELPEGSKLWTAVVSGEYVKPSPVSGSPRLVRIPLVKKAVGDPNIEVDLKYGGATIPLSGWTSVRFPLIHSRNIQPASSKVRLILPAKYRLFNFGGNAEPVSADQYQRHLTEDLDKERDELKNVATHGDDYFAKARAFNNLKFFANKREQDLAEELQKAERHNFNEMMDGTALLKDQLAAEQTKIRKELGELNAQQAPLQQDSEGQIADNREKLGELVQSQENFRAGDQVYETGRNFAQPALPPNVTASPETAGGKPANPQKGLGFRAEWLEQNKLNAKEGDKKPGETKSRLIAGKDSIDFDRSKQLDRTLPMPMDPSNSALPTLPNPFAANPQGQAIGGQTFGVNPSGNRGVRSESEVERANRYQTKLQAIPQGIGSGGGQPGQSQANAPMGGPPTTGPQTPGMIPARPADDKWELALQYQTALGSRMAQPSSGAGGIPLNPMIDGTYSSLDFPLDDHLQDRQELYFLAPRGDISITAQAVSDPMLERLKILGIVLAALLAVWLLARFGLTLIEFVWQEGSWPAWAGTLVLLLMCMLFGVFPTAALAIFVVLVAMALILTASRRWGWVS